MDIEKLQKISSLAKELHSRGMASDINEATRMADSMLDKERGLSHIQDTLAGVPFDEHANFSFSSHQFNNKNIPQPIAGYTYDEPEVQESVQPQENRQVRSSLSLPSTCC